MTIVGSGKVVPQAGLALPWCGRLYRAGPGSAPSAQGESGTPGQSPQGDTWGLAASGPGYSSAQHLLLPACTGRGLR